jgi:hypothetical protein
MPNVFIAVPHYNQLAPQALEGLILATQRHRYSINTEGGSLLALMFNKLWCRALNARADGVTHFAMHHSDVAAQAGWVDTLLEEKDRVGADVLSVIVPIKDARGLTSTGWQDPTTRRITRLTMADVMRLPETFDAQAAGRPDQWLMINTGLWVCDLRDPWVEDVCFTILDGIGKGDDGRFYPRCVPEDWNFAAWCARRGLKVFATRKVAVTHYGPAGFTNAKLWGEWDTDRGDRGDC